MKNAHLIQMKHYTNERLNIPVSKGKFKEQLEYHPHRMQTQINNNY